MDEEIDEGLKRRLREAGDEREPTAAEMLAWRREAVFLPEAEATPEEFPYLRNLSAAFMYGAVVRPLEPDPRST